MHYHLKIDVLYILYMFINRKTRRLSKNNIYNQSQSEDISQFYRQSQIQISSYPALEYIFGFVSIGFSAYLLYSASGGVNGIEGFDEKKWWQFLIAVLPMAIGVGFIIACQIQTITISRKNNCIIATKARFFCFYTEQIKKQFTDLIGISVVKTGKQMTNISMTKYHIVLSFKTCDQLPILRCISQGKILDYFEEIRRIFSEEEISQKKVIVQNLVS